MSLLQWITQRRRAPADAVLHQSTYQNIYHCTVQKSASQWLRGILSDPRVHPYCGLASYQYQHGLPGKYDPRRLTERRFAAAFPTNTIATPIYVDFAGFTSIPKPPAYKAIFVMRDPRDIVVSWYFSAKHSHAAHGDIERVRQDLNRHTEPDGLRYAIDYLADYGQFNAQRSWANVVDANILTLRYEELIGPDQRRRLAKLMEFCDIRIPAATLDELLADHDFARLSGRRH